MSKAEVEVVPFVRRASGLVREIGPYGAGAISWSAIVGIGLHRMTLWGGFNFPGSDPVVSWVIPQSIFLLIAVCYVWMLVSMPRTGGEYIYISRTLNPALGFLTTWGMFLTNCTFWGMLTYWTVQTWGTGLKSAGAIINNPAWMNLGNVLERNIPVILGVSLILLALTALSAIFTLRWYMRLILAITIGSFIGGAFMIYTYATHFSPGAIQAAWDATYGTGTYNEIVNLATSTGFNASKYFPNTFSWDATFGGVYAAFFAGGIGTYAGVVGGEVKTPFKTAWIGIVGSTIAMGTYCLIMTFLITRAYGTFLYAYIWCYNYAYDGLGAILGYAPFFPHAGTLAIPLYPGNVAAQLVAALVIAYFITKDLPAYAIFTSRAIFAWSFDRFFPERFARLNRFRSPHYAILLSVAFGVYAMVVTALMDLGYVGASYFAMALIAPLMLFGLFIAVLTATLLPILRRDLYEKGWVLDIKGIPVPTILGIITTPLAAWMFFLGVQITSVDLLLATGIWLTVGLVIFCAYWIYNKKKGIDVESVYKVLPPA